MGEFSHILRRTGNPILLGGMDAVLDPEIDELARLAHRISPTEPKR
jgi:hypothetical protein